MRWLFLFVLTLNLVYIGWEMNKSSSDDYADVPALKNVQTIVLLSELKRQAADVAEAEQTEDTTGDKAEEVLVENTLAVAASIEQAETKQGDVEQAGSEQLQENAERTPGITVAVAQQPAGTNAAVDAKASAKPMTPTDVLPEKLSPDASCFTLGPFRNLGKLRALTREIKSYVIEADFRGREEKEPALYWVYIKPEKNRIKAIETGKRLKAKKIKDFYVIRDGEKINGLSLGHFRNKNGAYGLAKKVKNLGFDVIVEPVFKTYTIYWLDYQLASGVKIPESIFEKHAKSTKKNKISRLRRDCGA